jgi:hypothetical protein
MLCISHHQKEAYFPINLLFIHDITDSNQSYTIITNKDYMA